MLRGVRGSQFVSLSPFVVDDDFAHLAFLDFAEFWHLFRVLGLALAGFDFSADLCAAIDVNPPAVVDHVTDDDAAVHELRTRWTVTVPAMRPKIWHRPPYSRVRLP